MPPTASHAGQPVPGHPHVHSPPNGGLTALATATEPVPPNPVTNAPMPQPAPRIAADATLQSVLEAASDAMVLVASSGKIVFVNARAEHLFGRPRKELVGHDADLLMPARLRDVQAEERTKFFQNPIRHQMTHDQPLSGERKSGEEFPVEIRLSPVETDAGILLAAAFRDLTEWTNIDANALGKIEPLLQDIGPLRPLIEGTLDYAILLLDADGKVTTWNDAARRIKGYAEVDIVGQDFSRFYTAADVAAGKPAEVLRIAAQTGRFREEALRVRKDGSTFWANVLVTPLKNADGRLRGYTTITQDITERKQATEALETANKELEAFAYSVSHDLRAPLRSMSGFAQMLLDDHSAELSAEAKHEVDMINDSAREMGQLIDDLLAFSRLGKKALKPESFNPEDMARRVYRDLEPLCAGRDIRIRFGSMPAMRADPHMIKQVFVNLIGNAVKYSRKRQPAEIEIGWTTAPEPAYFVKDNGVGFDMKHAATLFGVFQRLHRAEDYEGTGVGLAIVRRIIGRHGGRVWANATLDAGATFYFTIPGNPK